MIVKLLTEHHFEFLSLKGGCTGSSESTHVKMPHCWKYHATAQLCFTSYIHAHFSILATSNLCRWTGWFEPYQAAFEAPILQQERLNNLKAKKFTPLTGNQRQIVHVPVPVQVQCSYMYHRVKWSLSKVHKITHWKLKPCQFFLHVPVNSI